MRAAGVGERVAGADAHVERAVRDGSEDPDGDGLDNRAELRGGTDPRKADRGKGAAGDDEDADDEAGDDLLDDIVDDEDEVMNGPEDSSEDPGEEDDAPSDDDWS